MTVTIVLSDCPPKLRGDMTKWLLEINTGVYVGNISARVKDELWERIVENIGHGHATMIFTASGEQRLDFRVHNAYWQPVDYDGIKLVRRPERLEISETDKRNKPGYSHAAKHRMAAKNQKPQKKLAEFFASDYVILDFETTGMDEKKDRIIEIGAIFVVRGVIAETKQIFVQNTEPLPPEIVRLTGIKDCDLQKEGIPLEKAIEDLTEFMEDVPIICHNAAFEQKFLNAACYEMGMDAVENRFIDTLQMAREVLPNIGSYQLSALADYLGVAYTVKHRALADCETTYGIYRKLNEIASPNQ